MPLSVRVSELQEKFSHDVLTVQEANNRSFSDESVVAFATAENQAVLTLNRKDFIIIHRTDPNYAGIIVCSIDDHWERRAQRIHDAISEVEKLAGQLILCIFCSGRQQLMKLPKGKSVRPTYSMNEDVGFSDLFKHFQVADCALIGASRE